MYLYFLECCNHFSMRSDCVMISHAWKSFVSFHDDGYDLQRLLLYGGPMRKTDLHYCFGGNA